MRRMGSVGLITLITLLVPLKGRPVGIFNFSQMKLVAITLVLWSFYAIFRLANTSSDPFDFSSSKTG